MKMILQSSVLIPKRTVIKLPLPHCRRLRAYSVRLALDSTFRIRSLLQHALLRRECSKHQLRAMSTTVDRGGVDVDALKADLIVASKLKFQKILDYAPILVRDACLCSQCVDPSTHQREFSFADIPVNITARSVQINERTNKILVEWENDIPWYSDHISEYTRNQVDYILGYTSLKDTQHVALWDNDLFKMETEDVDFEDLMNSYDTLAKALILIERHGLFFVRNVPHDEASVKHLANRLGRLRNTFYGDTWDVRSVPQAKNVAYTNKFLGYHMDLLYMKEPPGIQLLHTLENTCEGGESLFADSWKALDLLYSQSPELVAALHSYVRYSYSNDGYYYTDFKPVVRRGFGHWPRRRIVKGGSRYLEHIDRVYWSPPFVSTIGPDPKVDLRDFVTASKAFSNLLESSALTFQTKTKPGTCAIFDNLRVVHARASFDTNSGNRWLKGAYADIQDVLSQRKRVNHKIFSMQSEKRLRLEDREEAVD